MKKKKQIITIAALIFLFAAIPSVANSGSCQKDSDCGSGSTCRSNTVCQSGVCSPTTYSCVAAPGNSPTPVPGDSCAATCTTVGNGECSKMTEGWRCACTKGSCTSGYAECHAVADPNCHVSTSGGTPTPAPASCKVDADCGRGQICYQSTVCNMSVGGCTSTFSCREPGYVPVPPGGFPPAPDGLWHCSGCSNTYNNAFARWTSTTGDCEIGIVEGSQEYTSSCGCITPGKPQPTGISVDCSSSNPSLFVCSGCDMYNSTQRMFVEWLSRYPDCSDKVEGSVNNIQIQPIYQQDLSCDNYAPSRATPTPTPMPEGECSISVANNPCTINNWTQTAGQGCGTMINWNSGSDIQICFNTGAMNQTQQSNPTYMSNTATMNPNLLNINGSYCYNYGSDTAGSGSKFITLDIIESPVTIEGIIDGVVRCSYTYTIVQSSGNVPIPSLAPADCKYEADGKTPICPVQGIPGSHIIGGGKPVCGNGYKACGGWLDACGCPGIILSCVPSYQNCPDYNSDNAASAPRAGGSTTSGGFAKGDVNSDGKVNMADIWIFFDNYRSANSVVDVNGDGKVDIFDYNMLVGNFGK